MAQMNMFEELLPTFKFTKTVRLFESFAGIGCQRMALKRLKMPFVSVGISEIDKYALKSYEAIHGDCLNYGDITKMQEIPPCDIFTYSFPCTDLSKAGKQKGLNGTRSGLVYEVLRLLKVSAKPQVLIMENVVDLVQTNFKKAFDEICLELESLGYTNYWQVLNGKDYGVAQNRERVFMVSIFGEYYYEFPKPFPLTKRLKDYLEPKVDEKYYISERALEGFSLRKERNEKNGIGFGFSPQTPEDIGLAIKTTSGTRPDDNFITEPISLQQVAQLDGFESTGRIYSQDGLCPTINTMGGGKREPKISEPSYRIRKLTPLECWRLMDISDSDFRKAEKAVSASQLYKQAGNGIIVNVFALILKNLFEQTQESFIESREEHGVPEKMGNAEQQNVPNR